MTRREYGAGVSVMWVIFLIVMLIGCGSYLYLVQKELKDLGNAAKNAEAAQEEAEANLVTALNNHAELSKLVGYTEGGGVYSSLTAARARLKAVKDQFTSEIGDGDNTTELVIEKLVAMSDRLDQEAQAARTQFNSERKARQDTENSKSTMQSNLDASVASLNSDLGDARTAAAAAASTADDRYNQIQSQLNDAAAAAREREDELQAQVAATMDEVAVSKGRVDALARKNELIGNPEDPWEPDGKVVDAGGGIAIIDIGGHDLLLPGVRFDVYYYGKGGVRIPKGTIEVRKVEAKSAECAVLSQANPLDPIARNDTIANPQFSKNRSRVFALIGDFPGYGRSFLKTRLENQGSTVVDNVTAEVDFVVLGSKAAEEDALEPTEFPEYKLAQELRIQTLRLRDIEHFLMP